MIAALLVTAIVIGTITAFALGNALWVVVAILAGAVVAARRGNRQRAEQQAAAIAAALRETPKAPPTP